MRHFKELITIKHESPVTSNVSEYTLHFKSEITLWNSNSLISVSVKQYWQKCSKSQTVYTRENFSLSPLKEEEWEEAVIKIKQETVCPLN